MENSVRRNKIIGMSIGICLVLLIIVASTYALWQVTKTQKDKNSMIAACLDLDLNKVGEGTPISLENSWPMTSANAQNDLTGYTFTVTNNCSNAVNYIIGLESVDGDANTGYMSDSAVALSIDNEVLGTYGSLNDIEGPDTYRSSKELKTASIGGNATKTHLLKIWIDENAPITEQGKQFNGKIFITGGQGIKNDNEGLVATPENCFTIDSNGVITAYDTSCGENVVIPESVNKKDVKKIATSAFRQEKDLTDFMMWNDSSNATYDSTNDVYIGMKYYILVKNESNRSRIEALLNGLTEEDQTATITYVTKESDVPETATAGEEGLYYILPESEDGEMTVSQTPKVSASLVIKGVNFSKATKLEEIEKFAFSNVMYKETTSDGKTSYELDTTQTQRVGLTSLNFGVNTSDIKIGVGAFAYSNIDTLELYGSLIFNPVNEYSAIGYFEGSTINNLTFTYVTGHDILGHINTNETVANGAFTNMKINKLEIAQGYTEIYNAAFAQSTITNVIIPNSVTKIDDRAFNGLTNASTITIKRADATGMTLGSNWSGDAVVKYEL